MFWGVKRTLADTVFSNWIRERDDWTCQRCGAQFEKPSAGLHNSHFFSRAKRALRFEPDNCVALCFNCHKHFTAEDEFRGGPMLAHEHKEFVLKRIGQKRLDELEVLSHTTAKIDESAVVLVYRDLLKKMKENRKFLK